MNLQTHISDDLWKAVSQTYTAGNFTPAILDAIHYLSELLREKSGADGDGANLVGQALGGNSPRLRITRMQTETEINVQRGMEQLLRGFYQAIRNPRSHEQAADSQKDADAIILFVDYLTRILGSSQEAFTIPSFLDKVFDVAFVESRAYSDLLAAEVPPSVPQ